MKPMTNEERGLAALNALESHRIERMSEAAEWRRLVREVIEAHPGPAEQTGEQIRMALGQLTRRKLPSLRSIQRHASAIRAERSRQSAECHVQDETLTA